MVSPNTLQKVKCSLCRQVDRCHSISMMLGTQQLDGHKKNYLDIHMVNIACSKLYVQDVFYYIYCM